MPRITPAVLLIVIVGVMILQPQWADARSTIDEKPSTLVTARSLSDAPTSEFERGGVSPPVQFFATRVDTTFLFAASGPGSFGSPGTDARGFNFDGGEDWDPQPEPAGWVGVDLTEQTGVWWHIASTDICAGSGTDMSQALPFNAGDLVNDHAVWCGIEDACHWQTPPGYGNNWDQLAVIDLEDVVVSDNLSIEFAYAADFEGAPYDYFEVLVMSYNAQGWELGWETVFSNGEFQERLFREDLVSVALTDFSPEPIGTRIAFRFTSDSAWSDEDGLLTSDVGAVWLDNIRVAIDDVQVFAADFEDGLQPPRLSFETPPGAGLYAELYHTLFQEDVCILNETHVWAFFDPDIWWPPVFPYGPPYVHNAIQSSLLEVDASGAPFALGQGDRLEISYWVYEDLPLNALIFYNVEVAAYVDEEDCLAPFHMEPTVIYGDRLWLEVVNDVTDLLLDSANGQTPVGVSVRLDAHDLCDVWCNVMGDGTGHKWAPYFDNVRVYLLSDTGPEWTLDGWNRLQDNFPDEAGKVRIDAALDTRGWGGSGIQPGDSTVIDIEAETMGGVAESYNPDAGELRPAVYLHWRLSAGPHEGLLEAGQADPDASDGIWSPWTGVVQFHGQDWGSMQCDFARIYGMPFQGRYAFDFSDDYFEPGDVIEYFYRMETVDGGVYYWPLYSDSSNPDLREPLHLSCLPVPGSRMLLVEASGEDQVFWTCGLRYAGYHSFDVYTMQSPGSGDNNSLAGRADLDDLRQYECVLYDTGDKAHGVFGANPGEDKALDGELLRDWLAASQHNAALWLMGDRVAWDMGVSNFYLTDLFGAQLVGGSLSYYDLTGIPVPRVYAIHPALSWLGGEPDIWVDGGCPEPKDFSLLSMVGSHCEQTHAWEDDGGMNIVAGILNLDPDGNGLDTNDNGVSTRSMFNPFSYHRARDTGYGTPAGMMYYRLMLRHVLYNLLNIYPDGDVPVDDTSTALVSTWRGAWPNPFNPSTTIAFSLAEGGQATLRVFDITGRLVRELLNGRLPAGEHEFTWDGRDDSGVFQSSGVYFVALKNGNFEEKSKLVLLK